MKMTKGLLVAVIGLSVSAFGGYREPTIIAHWTGAADKKWDNPANWVVEGLTEADPGFHAVPGVLKDSSGNYTGSKCDQAVFDRADIVNTTVNMGTLVCISNVTVKGASTPKIEFQDTLPMGDGSTFKVEADVLNVPTIRNLKTGTFRTNSKNYFTIINDAASVLRVVSDVGYISGVANCDPFSGFTGDSNTYMYIRGSGDIAFESYFVRDRSGDFNLYIYQMGNAKVEFRAKYSAQMRTYTVTRQDDTDQLIEVPNNFFGDYAAGYDAVAINSNTKISGDGTYHCGYGSGRNDTTTVAAGKLFWIDCEIKSHCVSGAAPAMGAAFKKNGGGTMRVTNAGNYFEGMVELAEGVLEANGIGLTGETSALGKCGTAVGISAGARFRYIGAGETTDKGFRVTTSGTSEFEHAGTGDLTFSSAAPFTATSAANAHAVKLYNDSGYRGIFASGLTTDDANLTLDLQSGVWQFNGANTFTGTVKANAGTTVELAGSGSFATPLALAGSKVRVIGGDETATAWSFGFANASGTSTIEVEGKAAITITDVSVTAGSVNFVVPDMNVVSIVFSGKTSADEPPAGVTVNGFALRFDDNGKASYRDDRKITGDRDVEVSGYARYDLLNSANDYTGKTILHGEAGAWIYAMWPGSIPNYAKTEANDGRITVPLAAPGYGTVAWTDAKILELANSATLAKGAVIAVDTTTSGDHTIALSDANVTSDVFGIGSDGANKLTVTGAPSKKVNFASFNGTLEFKGNKGLKLGAGNLSGDPGTGNFGTVVLDGVDASISDDKQPIYIGGRKEATAKSGTSGMRDYCGKLVIKDSQLSNSRKSAPGEGNQNFIVGGTGSSAGRVGPGVIELVGETTCVTGLFNLAGDGYRAQAAVYQRNGKVVNWCEGDNRVDCRPYFAYMGSAYWQLDAGTYEQLGSSRWSGNEGCIDTLFVQYGGNAHFRGRAGGNTLYWSAGVSNCSGYNSANISPVRYYLRGGRAIFEYVDIVMSYNDTYGFVEFAVDGPTAELDFGTGFTSSFGSKDRARVSFILNDGGTLSTTVPVQFGSTTAIGRELVFSFNGGILKAAADNLAVFGPAVGDAHNVTRVVVYEKGATFDTNGKTMTLNVPLTAPTGLGVKSAILDSSCIADRVMVAPPNLKVYYTANGGFDASLFPEFDSATHSVTNVRVLCAGTGYASAPEVQVRANGGTQTGYVRLEMGEQVGGGLVKEGAGTLVLGVANTYAGDTVVSNGVLKLAADGALANPTVKLCGGSLDVADGISYPAGLTLDVSGVPTEKASTLAENWTSDTLPTIVGVADGWRVDKVGTRLRHHRDVGLLLIVK